MANVEGVIAPLGSMVMIKVKMFFRSHNNGGVLNDSEKMGYRFGCLAGYR
jgi:hypothetical protein